MDEILDLLASDPVNLPDMLSVNLGHIVAWEPVIGGPVRRRTIRYPNAYDDISRLLSACAMQRIRPELGVMDLGFVSNGVTLRNDNVLPERPWYLIELDSPAYGSGVQVAPSNVASYDALTTPLREHLPTARWAAHGQGVAGYAVIDRALGDGSHVRVGFEYAIHLPDGRLGRSNAELVRWAVEAAGNVGRVPATIEEVRLITGCDL